jgi:hypothetical protein
MSLGIVTVRSYGRYDINGFRFRSTKFESTHPLVATTNTGVVCTTKDDRERRINYYGIVKDILVYDFTGPNNLQVVFFQCDWFDPYHGTRENQFGMVEVRHENRTRACNEFVLAHQVDQVYYMSYPCRDLKDWWVVYKVNPRERIHIADDQVYYQRNLQEGFEEIYQEDELPSSFNIDTELLSDALVGDQNDVVAPPKRKRVPRKKKVTWRPSKRTKQLDPNFEYD